MLLELKLSLELVHDIVAIKLFSEIKLLHILLSKCFSV